MAEERQAEERRATTWEASEFASISPNRLFRHEDCFVVSLLVVLFDERAGYPFGSCSFLVLFASVGVLDWSFRVLDANCIA